MSGNPPGGNSKQTLFFMDGPLAVVIKLTHAPCCLFPGQGQNPARKASINGGVPIHVPSCGVNMLCGSGLRAVVLGYQAIKTGDADIVVAGGQENMSLVC